MYIHLEFSFIIFDYFCVFLLEHFNVFLMILLLLAMFYMVFCKNFPG